MVYMLADEARKGTNFKVGYTRDFDNRMRKYSCCNPNAELIGTVITYGKTKMQLEKAIHKEILAMGFEFIVKDGHKTEWFFVPMEIEQEFKEKGLAMFKACKGRKIYR